LEAMTTASLAQNEVMRLEQELEESDAARRKVAQAAMAAIAEAQREAAAEVAAVEEAGAARLARYGSRFRGFWLPRVVWNLKTTLTYRAWKCAFSQHSGNIQSTFSQH
jgi:hypothetical protein